MPRHRPFTDNVDRLSGILPPPRSLAAQATVAATLVLSFAALSLVGLMVYVLLV